jgi:ankyrin repeat protein
VWKSKGITESPAADDINTGATTNFRVAAVRKHEGRTGLNPRTIVLPILLLLAAPVLPADPAADLVAAALAGREPEVRELLAGGADANTKNPAGRPVLVIAGFNGNWRTARALLSAGADVNAVDGGGVTALMAASAFAHLRLVELLVSAGADVNLKDSVGRTALARASQAGHAAVAERLKQAGAVEEAAP